MAFSLGPVGQIGIGVSDIDRSDAFYGGTLGLPRLFRFGTMAFFDCGGVRLMIDQATAGAAGAPGSPIYFRVADIALARSALEARDVVFDDTIHMTAPMEDHDLWMTFFRDPDSHILALMMEGPKGYTPAGAKEGLG